MTPVRFLSRVQLVWVQSFPSPRLNAKPRLSDPIWPIYLNQGDEKMDSCFSQGNYPGVKRIWLRPVFELRTSNPKTRTMTLWVSSLNDCRRISTIHIPVVSDALHKMKIRDLRTSDNVKKHRNCTNFMILLKRCLACCWERDLDYANYILAEVWDPPRQKYAVLVMTLNCIWWWVSCSGALAIFILLRDLLWPGVVILVRFPSMS